jgi:hypothetical protein
MFAAFQSFKLIVEKGVDCQIKKLSLKLWNAANTSDFCLVKSSINSKKCLLPFKDVVGFGPHT